MSVRSRESRKRIILPHVERGPERVAPELRDQINRIVRGEDPWPLLIYGSVGIGKTCAALCLCDAVGGGCRYTTATELASDLIAADRGHLYDEQSGQRITPERYWREWRESPLCVLDELGTRQKVTDWQYECVKRAIDAREGKPVIFVSNVAPDGIFHLYDERVASRICAGSKLDLVGEDRRIARAGS